MAPRCAQEASAGCASTEAWTAAARAVPRARGCSTSRSRAPTTPNNLAWLESPRRARGCRSTASRRRRPCRPRRAGALREPHHARLRCSALAASRPATRSRGRTRRSNGAATAVSDARIRPPAAAGTRAADPGERRARADPKGREAAKARARGARSTCAKRASASARRTQRARARAGAVGAASRAIQASTSATVRGMPADRFSQPSAVTSTSSSMRTPMPRNSSGHRQVVGLEVEPRLDREDHALEHLAVEVQLAAGLRAVVHVDAEVVARAVHHVPAVVLQVGVERLLGAHRQQAPLGGLAGDDLSSRRRAPRGTGCPASRSRAQHPPPRAPPRRPGAARR